MDLISFNRVNNLLSELIEVINKSVSNNDRQQMLTITESIKECLRDIYVNKDIGADDYNNQILKTKKWFHNGYLGDSSWFWYYNPINYSWYIDNKSTFTSPIITTRTPFFFKDALLIYDVLNNKTFITTDDISSFSNDSKWIDGNVHIWENGNLYPGILIYNNNYSNITYMANDIDYKFNECIDIVTKESLSLYSIQCYYDHDWNTYIVGETGNKHRYISLHSSPHIMYPITTNDNMTSELASKLYNEYTNKRTSV